TTRYDDLNHLFGKWSQDEFEGIEKRIDAARIIDHELWQ
ncbi:MAG: antitoxin, partial [Desulfatitalea sp.]|nr:antitoxin [Desulfatitalea sp.]